MGSKFKPISYFIYILFKEPGGHFTQIFFFFKYQPVMETHQAGIRTRQTPVCVWRHFQFLDLQIRGTQPVTLASKVGEEPFMWGKKCEIA